MLKNFETQFAAFIRAEMTTDSAHDFNHVLRVVKTAKELCKKEQAISEVVIPAAWLHDCVTLPKNHPERAQSSVKAADRAVAFLRSIDYPEIHLESIHHAIVAHSFSANVKPLTLEAKIVQDADRLDALGAIGVTRCIQVSANLNRPTYCTDDPFCESRRPDDGKYTIDHFYTKLLLIADTVNTASAKAEAGLRTQFMRDFLEQLNREILAE